MSRENVAVVRALYGALSRGDLDAAASNLGAEVEWDTRVRGSDGALVYGVGGVISDIAEWLEAWVDATFELREVRDAGGEVAVPLR